MNHIRTYPLPCLFAYDTHTGRRGHTQTKTPTQRDIQTEAKTQTHNNNMSMRYAAVSERVNASGREKVRVRE